MLRLFLLILACVLFLLEALHVSLPRVNFGWLGLLCLAATFLLRWNVPPTDQTPQATILYLSRLLAAIAMRSPKKEIRIAQSTFNEICGAEARKALFEDYDEKTDQIVLTYRQKSVATYLVEGVTVSTTQPTTTPSSTTGNSRIPLTDAQITSLEQKLAREKQYRAIKREPQQSFNL